ncbi:heme-binding protein [Ruegeria sp. 2012CJ41-6]|uniref:Heme-binding protein n=1 Tax=Ruegeria spongiae TaxID=2942209 RepID=A0ABT0PXY9_9RHOB|nr:heme-binding protein [Ruegeria spongiae]MCL6282490.1 heme-binding protein [Ruegeria spongiae]
MFVETTQRLTDEAILAMLTKAVAKATEIGQPQCIVIVDASGVTLGQIRMNGAKYLSLKSASAKARTAASIGAETTAIPEHVGLPIAAATEGDVTRLGGGLPIHMDDHLIGGIGVGSGSPEQDLAVARAALDAIGAQ